MDIILGSQSPRRRELLSYLLNDFKVLTAELNEDKYIPLARTPEEFVTKLSQLKAKKIISINNLKNSLIIAADTIVVVTLHNQWHIIGKPKDEKQALSILKTLRGKTHQVLTGFSIIDQLNKKQITDYDVSKVTFKLVSDNTLQSYIKQYKPYDKAGSYAIQEMGTKYIEKYEGSLTNIIGLPTEKLAQSLESLKVKINNDWQEKININVKFV
jgi:septum formation protein